MTKLLLLLLLLPFFLTNGLSGPTNEERKEQVLLSGPTNENAADHLSRGRAVLLREGEAGAYRASLFFNAGLHRASLMSPPTPVLVELLEQAAFVRSILKQTRSALSARTDAFDLELRARNGSMATLEIVQAYLEIAMLQQADGYFAGALATARSAREMMTKAAASAPPSSSSSSSLELRDALYRLETQTLGCAGSDHEALQTYDSLLVAKHGSNHDSEVSSSSSSSFASSSLGAQQYSLRAVSSYDLTQFYYLLKRVMASESLTSLSALQQRRAAVRQELTRRGYRRAYQLPCVIRVSHAMSHSSSPLAHLYVNHLTSLTCVPVVCLSSFD